MILVVGATGLVGSEVCRKLAARGESVRALARATSNATTVQSLRTAGVEIVEGDLKDPASLASACRGVDAVISTASSTLSSQPGDSIESVDHVGQLSLISAAKAAGISRFLLVSFRRPPGFFFPVGDAKQAAEAAIADMNYTVLQASFFMEVWLSPALGFDYANHFARVYGTGESPVSWVSYRDVAEMCAVAIRHPAAERQIIPFGGPRSLGLLKVIALFEQLSGKPFQREQIPLDVLHANFDQASEPMEKSFAALMLGAAYGDDMDMSPVIDQYGLRLATVEDYAQAVLAQASPGSSSPS